MRRIQILLASAFALALLVLPSVTRADSVSYYVVGSIAGGTSNATGSSLSVGGRTLSFFNDEAQTVGFDPALGDVSNTTFGYFQVTGSGTSDFTGVGFNLTVYQTSPNPGLPDNTGMVVANLTGGISSIGTNLKLDFTSPTTFTIPWDAYYFPPTVRYSFDDVIFRRTGASYIDGQVSIIRDPGGAGGPGDPSAVPLPSVAGLGGMLMSMLLLARTRRPARAA